MRIRTGMANRELWTRMHSRRLREGEAAMIKIGIVGCGWILRSHLNGYKALREAGFDQFRITALAARKEDDARRYLRRGKGPPTRDPSWTGNGRTSTTRRPPT